jgi:hypothetical protein
MRKSVIAACAAIVGVLAAGVVAQADNDIVFRVSAGSSDIVDSEDKNYSLIALKNAAGEVWGQYQDSVSGYQGLHMTVTHLEVFGNLAIVGGVVTKSNLPGFDVGGPVCTFVQDNGAQGDKISATYPLPFARCLAAAGNAAAFLYPIGGGQVSVKAR